MQKWDVKSDYCCLFCTDFSQSGHGDSPPRPERGDWSSTEGEAAAEAAELDAGELLQTRQNKAQSQASRSGSSLQISDAVYRQVLCHTTGLYNALLEACEAQRVPLDARLRTDMDQIITSKEHVTNKIRGGKRPLPCAFYIYTVARKREVPLQAGPTARISAIIGPHPVLSPHLWLGGAAWNEAQQPEKAMALSLWFIHASIYLEKDTTHARTLCASSFGLWCDTHTYPPLPEYTHCHHWLLTKCFCTTTMRRLTTTERIKLIFLLAELQTCMSVVSLQLFTSVAVFFSQIFRPLHKTAL